MLRAETGASPRSHPGGAFRSLFQLAVVLALVVAALTAYAHWPSVALSAELRADRVLVLKSERKLVLWQGDVRLREYRVALGFSPMGHKEREGDGKTPEGVYLIDYRNAASRFHRSLHISYPSPRDIASARKRGVSPGGMIMIHGLGSQAGHLGRLHTLSDWTLGCIAVTNEEIEEVWRLVPDGTPIEIRP